MTNKQEALIALKKLRPMTGNDTPNEYWFEIAAVISTHMDTIRAALTEAQSMETVRAATNNCAPCAEVPKVDVEKLAEEISLAICKEDEVDPDSYDEWWAPNRQLNNPERALCILTTHYDLVKKEG